MNHQTEKSGMHVENPLELQMLFNDRLLIDGEDRIKDTVVAVVHSKEEEAVMLHTSVSIAFFMDIDKTRAAGFNDIETLLGKMLMVTELEGKVPSMESAEILNLFSYNETDFNAKVQQYRKTVIFTDTWPFQENFASKYHIFTSGNIKLLITPSLPAVMADITTKKEFALHLKQYFSLI